MALQDDNEEGEVSDEVDEIFILDDKAEFSNHAWEDNAVEYFKDGAALATPGPVSPYFVSAMMHCPDSLDELNMHRHVTLIREEEEREIRVTSYVLLVLIADQIACEEGWVLQG